MRSPAGDDLDVAAQPVRREPVEEGGHPVGQTGHPLLGHGQARAVQVTYTTRLIAHKQGRAAGPGTMVNRDE
jgi:hypothetical protein